jgi:hypothetical protein
MIPFPRRMIPNPHQDEKNILQVEQAKPAKTRIRQGTSANTNMVSFWL